MLSRLYAPHFKPLLHIPASHESGFPIARAKIFPENRSSGDSVTLGLFACENARRNRINIKRQLAIFIAETEPDYISYLIIS